MYRYTPLENSDNCWAAVAEALIHQKKNVKLNVDKQEKLCTELGLTLKRILQKWIFLNMSGLILMEMNCYRRLLNNNLTFLCQIFPTSFVTLVLYLHSVPQWSIMSCKHHTWFPRPSSVLTCITYFAASSVCYFNISIWRKYIS